MLACSIFVYAGINVSYASPASDLNKNNQLREQQISMTDNIVMSQSKVPLQKVTINPYDSEDVEFNISKYKLQPETAKNIREYVEKCQNGEISSGGIGLYVPVETSGQLITPLASSTRTYDGYGNRKYYEETINYYNNSDWKTIKETTKDKWSDYLKTTLNVSIRAIIDAVGTTYAGGYWTAASIFTAGIPSNVPANSTTRFQASLVESKVVKMTYIWTNNGINDAWSFGSHTEYDIWHFQNVLKIPGFNDIAGKDSTLTTSKSKNYDTPDKAAYLSYVNGGTVEVYSNFTYGGVTFNSI